MKKNVIILYGGKSCEHDVSIVTAMQIYEKIDKQIYECTLVYLSRDNQMFIGKNLNDIMFYKNFCTKKLNRVVILDGDNNLYLLKTNKKFKQLFTIDFAINACHGGIGENGVLSGKLFDCGIPNSSGNHYSMGVSMDKSLTKMALKTGGFNYIEYLCVDKSSYKDEKETIYESCTIIGYPLIVKPATEGSSVGVCLVNDVNELDKAINYAFNFGYKIIVEKAITAKREFNCAILRGKEGLIVSEIEEPIASSTIISFNEKYLDGKKGTTKCSTINKTNELGMANSKRKFPAEICLELSSKIKTIARHFYEMLNLNGVVRIDFIYDTVTEDLFLSEANTLPGSLGYYFFDGIDFIKTLIDGGTKYYCDYANKMTSTIDAKIF